MVNASKQIEAPDLKKFSLGEFAPGMVIAASSELKQEALAAYKKSSGEIQKFLGQNPNFMTSIVPVRVSLFAPGTIKRVARNSKIFGRGPAIAERGALVDSVGEELLRHSQDVIVEKGGLFFVKTGKPRRISIFAKDSVFSGRIAIEIDPTDTPCGVATQKPGRGRLYSHEEPDGLVVVATSASLAEAASYALLELVKDENTLSRALDMARKTRGIKGVLILKDDKMAVMGKIKIISI
ncbi:MAG: hypothetical protein ABIJ26_03740 [Candidatus Margulisiibacteriota bacterium]